MGAFFGGGGASGVGGSTGATDNSILRADGTGGATLQNSALVVDDAALVYSCTGVAATDIITAVGHNFTENQAVRFLTLTGGNQLLITASGAIVYYFVRNISGDTFQVSTTSGGAAVNFTTDMTAGTIVAVMSNVTISNQSTDTNSSTVITQKGTGAIIFGRKPDATATGGNARGDNAVDLQTSRTSATQVASGQGSFVCGVDNTSSQQYAVCMGGGNTASGSRASCVGGLQNTASGVQSFIGSGRGQTASGDGAVVVGGSTGSAGGGNTSSAAGAGILSGRNGLADRFCIQAFAGGQFAAGGDAQRIFAVLRCKTTTNSAVEMALDGSTTYLTIPSGKVMFCNIKVVGVKSDGATVATYERQYAAKNVAGTSTQVYAPVTIGTDNAAGTSLAVSTNDTGDYISIQPTGVASETWRWVASVDAVEVAYGT